MTLKKIAGIGVATLILAATSAQAHDGKYVQDSYGNVVKDSYQNCVVALYGNMLDGCEAAAEPAPAPAPPPPAAPVRPRTPAPAPVVPKVKAKGNYKGPVQMAPADRNTLRRYQ